MEIVDKMLSRKLLLISGKGGVGKSFFASCLASYAAKHGKRVLLVEHTLRSQISPLFGIDNVEHTETVYNDAIFGINLDAKECFREYVVDYLGMNHLYNKIFGRKVMRSFLEAIPGLNELMVLGRLIRGVSGGKKVGQEIDLVVFDAPASGHFYKLLTTPDAVINSGLVGPLVREIEKIRSFLFDKELCSYLLVSVPEELVRSETLEFINKISTSVPIFLEAVIVNRALRQQDHQSECFSRELRNIYQEKSELGSYIIKIMEKRRLEQLRFMEDLEVVGLEQRTMCIPDFGIVMEPLSKQFHSQIWDEAYIDGR